VSGNAASASGTGNGGAALPAQERVPDFFLIGQPKSGTTALYEALGSHPEIFMPANKEPWFFADELHERTPPREAGTPKTLEEYLELFRPAESGQLTGEASALYLWSRTAAERIAQVAPDARIIAILREPANLLRSLHLQFVKSYIETEPDLRRALELEGARRQGREIPRHTYWPKALLYSDHVRYVEQLRRYEEQFGRDQMLVLIYDDFRRDNEGTVRRVLEFLEADEGAPVRISEANPSVGVRSQRLHELVHAVSVGRGPVSRAVKGTIKTLTPRALRRDALSAAQRKAVYSSPPPEDAALMREMRARYREEVVSLSEYLDRDLLELWGHGDN
jgi:hypothetical protein